MELIFTIGVVSAFIAAGCIGALVALKNLKAEWGDQFVMTRPSVAPSTVPETPNAKRRRAHR